MAGKEKKWGMSAERDLAMAIILAQGGDRAKYDWPKVHEYMSKWGYEFTRDAMSQHWTKRIMKDFKQRHGETPSKAGATATNDGGSSVPATPVRSRKKSAAGGSTVKAKKEKPVEDEDDERKYEYDELSSPAKKRKLAPIKQEVKQEPNSSRLRDRSMTAQAGEADFEA